jgi:hypothetical protein
MLLSAMLEVRAWALARPVSEQDATGDALVDRMEQVKRTEEEQGRFSFVGRHGVVNFKLIQASLLLFILLPLFRLIAHELLCLLFARRTNSVAAIELHQLHQVCFGSSHDNYLILYYLCDKSTLRCIPLSLTDCLSHHLCIAH